MRSDYQRIGKQLTDLQPLDFAQGRKLIDSRLALVHELKEEDPVPVAALRAVYEQHHGRCNARRLIHEARRLFAEWQKCALPNASSIPDFLLTQMESLWADADVRRHSEQADAVLAHGLPAVLELLGYKTTSTHTGLTIDRGDTGRGETGIDVVFVNQANMRSLAATLKRLLEKHASAAPLRLVRDQRLPISPSASVTRQRLRKIEERGGRLVRVEAEALAALHAVRQLLTAATSGDLSPNGEAVEAKTVREWLAQNLPREVRNLAADLLDAETQQTENRSPDALLELIARRKVAPVDELAALTHWSKEEIEDYARTHPLHVRWFGGPCPVVCQAVAPDAAKENGYAR
jgi:hypothetical protein